jgi:hypothetical protein
VTSPKQDLSKKYPVAAEILRQLGGGKALMITGAKAIFGKDVLTLQLGAKYLQIKLNAGDLYDIRYTAANKSIAEINDVFCEKLIETCEQITGLFFRL